MLFAISLDYENREKLEKLDPEKYEALRKELMWLPEEQKRMWNINVPTLVTVDDLELLLKEGVTAELKQIKNTYSPQKEGKWADNIPIAQTAVHVHTPNVGLLAINKVTVLEDTCTDELQRYLDSGWKIIAVCPPNGVRRPDYVLGRADE